MPPGHALITGGSSGIGLALARLLARDGANVTIVARDAERLARARQEIEAARKHGAQRVLALSADVGDEAAAGAAFASAIAELGTPELLVTSAGTAMPGRFEDLPPAAFRQIMETNFFGTVHAVRAALPAMRANRQGRIVMISSGAGLIGLYGYTAYAPSKFAVRGFAEALRSELSPERVGVSVVYPPDTDTPQLREEARHRPPALARIAAGSRILPAEAVARAILRGVARKRFVIAPGWEMGTLARVHSLAGQSLNRLWFDRVVARYHRASR